MTHTWSLDTNVTTDRNYLSSEKTHRRVVWWSQLYTQNSFRRKITCVQLESNFSFHLQFHIHKIRAWWACFDAFSCLLARWNLISSPISSRLLLCMAKSQPKRDHLYIKTFFISFVTTMDAAHISEKYYFVISWSSFAFDGSTERQWQPETAQEEEKHYEKFLDFLLCC